jgi:RNA polymerase sigma factor (sigma-70 family)
MLENTEDIVNEAFTLTWKTINKIPPHVKFRMWLWGVLRNVIRHRLNLFDRPYPFCPFTLDNFLDVRESHEGIASRKETSKLLHAYVSRLKPEYRDIIEDYYFKEKTQRECGKKINRSRKIVRDRVACAIRKLRDELEADGLSLGDF